MGIYSDGKIYGIAWVHSHNDNVDSYIKKKTNVLTDEERQEIYTEFLRLIPEKDRSLYRYSVYTRCYTTYEQVEELSFSWMWFPLEVKYMMEYFEKGSIVGF